MKKFIAFFLSLSMIFTIATPINASGLSEKTMNTVSFVDSEGKINSTELIVHSKGSTTVNYYIDGVFVNTVTSTIHINSSKNISSGTVDITYTDSLTKSTQSFSEPLSKYISDDKQITAPSPRAGYTYQGCITYKPLYLPDSPTPVTNKLYMYYQPLTTTYDYKTINANAGDFASLIISIIASVLTIIYEPLSILASDLLFAAAYAAGTTILSGVVQGAISKQYYVRQTPFNVKAYDTPTARERIFEGLRYQVALSGGGYSSEYYYEGYMPWNDNTVAYWLHCSFFGDTFPGVSSYT